MDSTHVLVQVLGPPMLEPLTPLDVKIEANRCLYCYDAPCTVACPTSIDIPRFIRRIAAGDLAGSARTIMTANPMGASCARVCPTDELCEGACSLMGVDLETWNPIPHVDGKSSHGGFCGPAVKPIALNMVGDCARDPGVSVPISGIGGISNWRDAVEFMLMGSANVQVCTAVMRDGFRIVGDMIEGLNNYLDERGIAAASEIVGKTVPRFVDWNDLNLDYKIVARIDPATCIHCNRCWIACEDAAHQCIDRLLDERGATFLKVDEEHCVGCNLCSMVCPVDECISMLRVDDGQSVHTWRERLSIPS